MIEIDECWHVSNDTREELMNKKRILITLLILLLVGGVAVSTLALLNKDNPLVINKETPDERPNTDVPEEDDLITCAEAITAILEDENHLTHVEGTLQWQRGGFEGNQFTIDFEENTMTFLDGRITYYKFSEDEYFYYRDQSASIEKERQGSIDTWDGDLRTDIYYGNDKRIYDPRNNRWLDEASNKWAIEERDSYLNTFHDALDVVGCPLVNESPSILNNYQHKKVASMDYFDGSLDDGLISNPAELIMCQGLDCSIKDHPKYVELEDWRNYNSLEHTTVIGNETWNNGKMIIGYNDTRYIRNLFLDDSKDVWHVYPEETFYKWVLGTTSSWNNFFFQNLFRDVLLDRWNDERSPKLYFMDTTKSPNQRFYDRSNTCTTNRYSFEEYSCSQASFMYFWRAEQDGLKEPTFAWNFANSNHPMLPDLLRTLSTYADLDDLSDDFMTNYIRVYDIDWQEKFGLREVYWETYGY